MQLYPIPLPSPLLSGYGNGELGMGAGNGVSADTIQKAWTWITLVATTTLTLSLPQWQPSHKSISLSPPQPPRHHPSPQSGRSAVTGYRGHHDSSVRSCDSHVTVNMNLIYLNCMATKVSACTTVIHWGMLISYNFQFEQTATHIPCSLVTYGSWLLGNSFS